MLQRLLSRGTRLAEQGERVGKCAAFPWPTLPREALCHGPPMAGVGATVPEHGWDGPTGGEGGAAFLEQRGSASTAVSLPERFEERGHVGFWTPAAPPVVNLLTV